MQTNPVDKNGEQIILMDIHWKKVQSWLQFPPLRNTRNARFYALHTMQAFYTTHVMW